jgi:hypothetical protein
MRPLQIVLLSLVVVLVILAVYVLLARPTVVLPTQTIALNDSTPLNAALKNSSLNGLDVRVRSDGTVTASAQGQEVATIDYTPQQLANALDLGQKIGLSAENRRMIRLGQILLPGLTYGILTNAYAAYHWLPLELNLRIVPG